MERTLLDVAIAKATKKAEELESTIRKVYKGNTFSYLGDRNPDALGQNYGIFAPPAKIKILNAAQIPGRTEEGLRWE